MTSGRLLGILLLYKSIRYSPKMYLFTIKQLNIFDLITAQTHISAVKLFLSLQITNRVLILLLYKSIRCWYSFELPQQVEAIQMSTNNLCFYKETQKKNHINIIKYALIQFPAYFSCKFVLIR